MTDRPAPARRRRPHAAASSRIVVGGLSTTAMFGMVTAMALAGGAGSAEEAATVANEPGTVGLDLTPATAGSPAPAVAPAPRKVVVVRRHFVTVPSGGATRPSSSVASSVAAPRPSTPVASAPAPAAPTPAPAPAPPPPPPPAPAPQPVATSHGS